MIGGDRLDGDAVGLRGAIAAILADVLVDEHARLGLCHLAALATATLLGGADLIVDDRGDARKLAQLALHGVHLVPAPAQRARGERGGGGQTGRVIGHDGELADALGGQLRGELDHRRAALGRLAAGHGDGVVEQQLVSHRRLGRDRLADREQARVLVSAVAHVGEHVRQLHERREADPGYAFAAHLTECAGKIAGRDRHRVTADAGHGEAAIGQDGRGVVRAAGAEHRRARQQAGRGGQGRDPGFRHVDAERAQHSGERRHDQLRRQFELGGQQFGAVEIELAEHGGSIGHIIECVADLPLDEGALLLDHDQRALAVGEGAETLGLERPGERDLIDRQPRMPVEPEPGQCVHKVVMRLADRHEADFRRRIAHDELVEPVRARPGEGSR